MHFNDNVPLLLRQMKTISYMAFIENLSLTWYKICKTPTPAKRKKKKQNKNQKAKNKKKQTSKQNKNNNLIM